MSDKLLALGMIVKDEEQRILATLNSCKDNISNFVILDTGSTDNTCNLIHNFCKQNKINLTLNHTSFIDFSTTRNELLNLIFKEGYKYSLFLDANDELQGGEYIKESLETLERLEKVPKGFFVKQLWKDEDKFVNYQTIRFIQNDGKWYYKGVVHEVLHYPEIESSDLPLLHDKIILFQNRDLDGGKTKSRLPKDLKLLEKEYKKNPKDGRTLYYLANTCYFMNEEKYYLKAIEYYTKRVNEFLPVDEEYYQSLIRIAKCNSFLNKSWDDIFPWLWKGWEMVKDIEPIVICAKYYYDKGDMQIAYMFTKIACNINVPNLILHIDKSFYDFKRWYMASMVYHHTNEYEEGYSACETALSYPFITPMDFNNVMHNRLMYEEKIAENIYYLNDDNRHTVLFFGGWSYDKWNGNSINSSKGLGGAETACVHIAEELVRMGYQVVICCDTDVVNTINGVEYIRLRDYERYLKSFWIDTLIVLRFAKYLRYYSNISQVYLWLEDTTFIGDGFVFNKNKLKKIITLCNWHSSDFAKSHPITQDRIKVIGNALSESRLNEFKKYNFFQKVKNRFIYSSCPSRGLKKVVELFPKIREIIPDATLHIFSNFDNEYINDFEKFPYIPTLKEDIKKYDKYIFDYGRVPQDRLLQEICKSEYWLYPTEFEETYCITALEMQAGRVLCLYNDIGALSEVIKNRGIIVGSDEIQILNNIRRLNQIDKESYLDNAEKWAFKQTWNERAKLFKDMIGPSQSHVKEKVISGYLIYDKMVLLIKLFKGDMRLTYDVLRNGSWEEEVLRFVDRYAESNVFIFIDVGANIGTHSLSVAHISKKVYAFEPDKEAFELLKENIDLNKIKNIIVSNVALGDKKGYINLKQGETNILNDKYIEDDDKGEVKCLTIDSFFNYKFSNDIIMKIDVQGYDLKVLRGSEKFIKKNKPVFILEMEEYCFKRYNQSSLEVYEYLTQLGYDIFLLITKRTIYYSHYIAIHKDKEIDITKIGKVQKLDKQVSLPIENNRVDKVLIV